MKQRMRLGSMNTHRRMIAMQSRRLDFSHNASYHFQYSATFCFEMMPKLHLKSCIISSTYHSFLDCSFSVFCQTVRREKRPSLKSKRRQRWPRYLRRMLSARESSPLPFVSFWMESAFNQMPLLDNWNLMTRIRLTVCSNKLVDGNLGKFKCDGKGPSIPTMGGPFVLCCATLIIRDHDQHTSCNVEDGWQKSKFIASFRNKIYMFFQ
jgi:hypothetical protein